MPILFKQVTVQVDIKPGRNVPEIPDDENWNYAHELITWKFYRHVQVYQKGVHVYYHLHVYCLLPSTSGTDIQSTTTAMPQWVYTSMSIHDTHQMYVYFIQYGKFLYLVSVNLDVVFKFEMSKHYNYDTKSSALSIDYKIPYDSTEKSRIFEHLEESQEELEFLKLKLTEVYEKLEAEIKANIDLSERNDCLSAQNRAVQGAWQIEKKENEKLKQVMHVMLQNRKMLEEEVEYTHLRYKKILHDKQASFSVGHDQIRVLQDKIQSLEEELTFPDPKLAKLNTELSRQNSELRARQESLIQQINILNLELQRQTSEKVTQVTRLKHELECYQRSLSPVHTRMGDARVRTEENKENTSNNVIQMEKEKNSLGSVSTLANLEQSNVSVGKWKRAKIDKTGDERSVSSSSILVDKSGNDKSGNDDKRLTECQMEKKKIQGQLIRVQRLKRHSPSDRELMQDLQHQIYQLDSQISSLKRKIRQKY